MAVPDRHDIALDNGGFHVRQRDIARSAKSTLWLAGVCMAAILSVCTQLFAGEVDVVEAKASRAADNSWRFDVTVAHADEGWDHYADLWQVIGPDGTVLGERVLAHPHVNEQPFTRSLNGVTIPDGVSTVTIRARDSVHGFGGAELEVVLK